MNIGRLIALFIGALWSPFMLDYLLLIPWEISSNFRSVGFFHQISFMCNSKPYVCNLAKSFSKFFYLVSLAIQYFYILKYISSLCFNKVLN